MESNPIQLNVGDTIRNSVGIYMVVSKLNEPIGTAMLTNHFGEPMKYNLHRLLENIASGKWIHYPKKKYAKWI